MIWGDTMKTMLLENHAPIEKLPLTLADLPKSEPGQGEVLLRVRTCGICHTDLHIIEGEVKPPILAVVIGHQVFGVV